jgi:hypothetical protein
MMLLTLGPKMLTIRALAGLSRARRTGVPDQQCVSMRAASPCACRLLPNPAPDMAAALTSAWAPRKIAC